MKATVRASQEKLEANQEKIEAIAKHYKEAPHVKATHLHCLVGHASDVLHAVQQRGPPAHWAMYKETNGAPENRYGDQHLVVAFHTLLKRHTKTMASPCMSSSLPSNR
jgi:hypothetical protein